MREGRSRVKVVSAGELREQNHGPLLVSNSSWVIGMCENLGESLVAHGGVSMGGPTNLVQ